MTPVPIIELQRRLTLVGAIRLGGEKPARGVGKRLETFRLTSGRRALLEQAGELYGGTVTPWESPVGNEYQLYTETSELPVLVMPGYSLRQRYELWQGATKRERVCDGIEEELTSGPCLCQAGGEQLCDLYTRLTVALLELDTCFGWRLLTRGANAAHELPAMMELLAAAAPRQTFVPARLHLDQRRGVREGQVVRYAVATLDPGASYRTLAERPSTLDSTRPAASFTPLPPGEPTPITEAVAQVARKVPPVGGRRKAPVGSPLEELVGPNPMRPFPGDEKPEPVVSELGATIEQLSEEIRDDEERSKQTLFATIPQKKQLDVLVGKLRDGGHISTEQLWMSIGTLRPASDKDMVDELGGRDEDGQLHWAPLREDLTRPEADQLIDWLKKKLERVEAPKVAPHPSGMDESR